MSLVGFKANNHPQQVGKRGVRDVIDDRGTPPELFDLLAKRFGGFTLDVAAAPHNAKCERFYTPEMDGLTHRWTGRVWCNPPYSNLGAWVAKAWREWMRQYQPPELIVMLVPANRTEQAWWQDLIEWRRDRGTHLTVEFLRGRTRFILPGHDGIEPNQRPPFGCALLIWSRGGGNGVAS